MSKKANVTIGWTNWTVELVDPHDPGLYVDNTVCRGACWLGHLRICISNELCKDAALHVLRHELSHAVIAATQICTPETYTEENLCDFMAVYSPVINQAAIGLYEQLFAEN